MKSRILIQLQNCYYYCKQMRNINILALWQWCNFISGARRQDVVDSPPYDSMSNPSFAIGWSGGLEDRLSSPSGGRGRVPAAGLPTIFEHTQLNFSFIENDFLTLRLRMKACICIYYLTHNNIELNIRVVALLAHLISYLDSIAKAKMNNSIHKANSR